MLRADTHVVATAAHLSAVAWIDRRHALVARNAADGEHTLTEVLPRDRAEHPDDTYLARVVDEIGDRERVVILGPGSLRLALEREYVSRFHRPDRLVDVEPSGLIDREALVSRLLTLAT
jgi:hypothetical protein